MYTISHSDLCVDKGFVFVSTCARQPKSVCPYSADPVDIIQPDCTFMHVKWSNAAGDNTDRVLVSHTGHRLARPVAFQFTLDPTRVQAQDFLACAGAARFAFNYHIAAVKANLTTRADERDAGVPADEMTPSLSWSVQSRINEFNAWKNGRHPLSPTNDDGTRGLSWRSEIPADVFECASVNAARALGNYSASAKGARAGIRVSQVQSPWEDRTGFPAAFEVQTRCHSTGSLTSSTYGSESSARCACVTAHAKCGACSRAVGSTFTR